MFNNETGINMKRNRIGPYVQIQKRKSSKEGWVSQYKIDFYLRLKVT